MTSDVEHALLAAVEALQARFDRFLEKHATQREEQLLKDAGFATREEVTAGFDRLRDAITDMGRQFALKSDTMPRAEIAAQVALLEQAEAACRQERASLHDELGGLRRQYEADIREGRARSDAALKDWQNRLFLFLNTHLGKLLAVALAVYYLVQHGGLGR